MKKKGFTLIELLVVIAIIAILAAILFPVFARARENARRASCQSNLKQIALGVFQYTQDYDEKMPLLYANLGTAGGYTDPVAATTGNIDQGWALLLQPYLKSAQIYQCPSETNPLGTTGVTADQAAVNGGAGYTDYFYNSNVAEASQASFDAVSLTILMGDYTAGTSVSYTNGGCTTNNGGNNQCVVGDLTGAPKPLATFPSGAAQRHLDGGNFAFADGHVKWFKGQNATTSASVRNGAYGTTNGHPTFRLTDSNAS